MSGALVALDGIIDLHVTKILESKFKEIVNSGLSLLAIQLENVKYIDSVGLRVLIDLNNLASSKSINHHPGRNNRSYSLGNFKRRGKKRGKGS